MAANDVFANVLASIQADHTNTYPEVRELVGAFTNMAQFYVTSVTGTGAALDVSTPGDPRFVIVINGNDGTTGIKLPSMATSNAMKLNATGPAVSVAANMITLGTDKFTIGNDAQLNTVHTLHCIAIL